MNEGMHAEIRRFCRLGTILVVNISVAEELGHKSIATGSAQWVSNIGDKSSTDAMVDIGAVRQIGDALEVMIRWPYLPSYGPEWSKRMYIIIGIDGALSFSVGEGHVSPERHFQFENVYEPAIQRAEAERRATQMAIIRNGCRPMDRIR